MFLTVFVVFVFSQKDDQMHGREPMIRGCVRLVARRFCSRNTSLTKSKVWAGQCKFVSLCLCVCLCCVARFVSCVQPPPPPLPEDSQPSLLLTQYNVDHTMWTQTRSSLSGRVEPLLAHPPFSAPTSLPACTSHHHVPQEAGVHLPGEEVPRARSACHTSSRRSPVAASGARDLGTPGPDCRLRSMLYAFRRVWCPRRSSFSRWLAEGRGLRE